MQTDTHYSWKVALGVGGLLIGVLIVLAFFVGETCADICLTLALVIGGGAFGWVVGVALSPDFQSEEKKFFAIWKGFSLFASGYLVSKIDPFLNHFLSPDVLPGAVTTLGAFRFVATFSTAVLSALIRIFSSDLSLLGGPTIKELTEALGSN